MFSDMFHWRPSPNLSWFCSICEAFRSSCCVTMMFVSKKRSTQFLKIEHKFHMKIRREMQFLT